ncbi:fumarylacetoacetase [Novosphingobium pentaromativorans]|uniref:fumarylacetoacetase n=1 Tax=Novosphingobium pentaromativorans US6-1 TaxID=1088721 RepID=G6E922_9SPHN|nr:fumarylacetoacetase [Novosphingobium pentaromativorans]AIT81156.1 fumarylacetoacetase [Novosphingobium pentaromativorans US6-1]EHJ62246.1 fumarylacetoacetase [Novosphingobium pentaromativorans US6-1]
MTFWQTDATHDPALASWVESAKGHRDFPIQNLPLGVFSPAGETPRIGVAIGDMILDLSACAKAGLLPDAASSAAGSDSLNAFMALPEGDRKALRAILSQMLADNDQRSAVEPHLHRAGTCTLHLPARIGDYTDFYVGIHHANNVGRQFRPDNPLLPNYKYVPIGYHGRASSIRASGVPLVRPTGQRKPPEADAPVVGPSVRLDYELELGVWIGQGNELGTPIPISEAANHIAGFCLLNDWSARDFQAWEYQPLGPFLAKNFHSTISPWVVTPEAMAPFRMAQPPRPEGDPAPLGYLSDDEDRSHGALAVTLEVFLSSAKMREAGMEPFRLSRGPASNMYWTVQQIVTHHASNGCNLQAGDLLGTGTISAPTRDGFGSLLELTSGGKEPISLPSGETRTFLEDGDEVTLRATAHAEGYVSIGFGECRAAVLPAR